MIKKTRRAKKLSTIFTSGKSLPQVFKLRIEERLVALGITKTDFAKRMGCKPPYVHQILSRPNVRLATVESVAKALECQPADLLS